MLLIFFVDELFQSSWALLGLLTVLSRTLLITR
jgi:hypothetical protein